MARNEQFRSLVGSAAAAALGVTALRSGSSNELAQDALAAAAMPDGSGRWVLHMEGPGAECWTNAFVLASLPEAIPHCGWPLQLFP